MNSSESMHKECGCEGSDENRLQRVWRRGQSRAVEDTDIDFDVVMLWIQKIR